MPLLSAEKITCAYGGGRNIVENLNLSFGNGEFTALIGPNGAGKTTIFRALSGFLRLKNGAVRIRDKNILRMSNLERSKAVAVVPQNVFTPLLYTVREIVEMGRISRISRFSIPSAKDRECVTGAMAMMDVLDYAGTFFYSLSGGEKQRVMIAMALAQEPDILLLDEPTSQLDIGHSSHLVRLLKKMNAENGITVILISHDIQLAAKHCKRVILLKDGEIVCDGSPRSVISSRIIEEVYSCKVRIVEMTDDDGNKSVIPVPI